MAQSLSLESFLAKIRNDIDRFEAAYRARAEQLPTYYVLERDEGLWQELFLTFYDLGEI